MTLENLLPQETWTRLTRKVVIGDVVNDGYNQTLMHHYKINHIRLVIENCKNINNSKHYK